MRIETFSWNVKPNHVVYGTQKYRKLIPKCQACPWPTFPKPRELKHKHNQRLKQHKMKIKFHATWFSILYFLHRNYDRNSNIIFYLSMALHSTIVGCSFLGLLLLMWIVGNCRELVPHTSLKMTSINVWFQRVWKLAHT